MAMPLRTPATAGKNAGPAGDACPAVAVLVPADRPTTVTNFCLQHNDPSECI